MQVTLFRRQCVAVVRFKTPRLFLKFVRTKESIAAFIRNLPPHSRALQVVDPTALLSEMPCKLSKRGSNTGAPIVSKLLTSDEINIHVLGDLSWQSDKEVFKIQWFNYIEKLGRQARTSNAFAVQLYCRSY